MPAALRAALAAAVLGAGLVAGCSSGATATETLVPPVPAASPAGGQAPVGTVLPLGGPATAIVVDPDTRTVATAVTNPPRLLLSSLDSPAPARSVALPGPAADISLAAPGGPLLVPVKTPGALVRVPLDGGAPTRIDLDGAARNATVVGGRTVVALGNRLEVLEADRPVRTITSNFADVTRLAPAGAKVAVLDGARSAITLVDPVSGAVGATVRAGNGAADLATDRFGRLLATDVRDGEFLALAGDPLLLRQRFPLPGAPYGLAYDPRRDLAWITLTARNEVVGLDVAGGEPVVSHRYPTVHQPDSVAVDPVSGRVFVASASGVGLQVIDPERVVQ